MDGNALRIRNAGGLTGAAAYGRIIVKACWLFGLSLLAGACGQSATGVTSPNCGNVGVPAITLVALDDRSRQPITRRALVIARDGPYTDTAGSGGTPPLYGMAYNRPGTYTVTAQLPGYESWRVDGVVAHQGQCNVSTVPLAAWMVPSAPATVRADER